MDIEEPLKREFFLFAPEITEKQVQAKGKNADQNYDRPFRGKIHFQKYPNNCAPVKLPGEPVNPKK